MVLVAHDRERTGPAPIVLKVDPPPSDASSMQMGRRHRVAARTRNEMWRRRREHAWRERRAVAAVAGVSVLVTGVVALWLVVARLPEFWIGFVAGAVLAAFGALVFWCVDHGAGAHNDKFGTYGEEATAELFRTRRARRSGWEVCHNVPFQHGDVDHVVFGPHGVLAVESKWANAPWRTRGESVDAFGKDPLDQAHRGARHVRHLLKAAGIHVHVIPVVIQWGPGGWSDETWTARWFEGGVLALRGRSSDALDEIDAITNANLGPEELARIRAALDDRVQGRESRSRPVSARV